MKVLVLYTTVDGNTEAVGEAIAERLGADVSKIVRVSKIRGFGIDKIRAWFEVKFNRRPGIFPFKHDPRDYDLIFIGTPVWYDSYSPVYNTLFEVIKIYDRKIAIFSTGETDSQKALEEAQGFRDFGALPLHRADLGGRRGRHEENPRRGERLG